MYLYAIFSIREQASASAKVFRSVVIEEMLHVALASNLLVAVGGQPKLYHQDTTLPFLATISNLDEVIAALG